MWDGNNIELLKKRMCTFSAVYLFLVSSFFGPCLLTRNHGNPNDQWQNESNGKSVQPGSVCLWFLNTPVIVYSIVYNYTSRHHHYVTYFQR